MPLNLTKTLLEYYLANKPADNDWYVLSITNIEGYLVSSVLNRRYIKQIIGTVIDHKGGRADAYMFRTKARTTIAMTETKEKMNQWLPFNILIVSFCVGYLSILHKNQIW